MTIPVAWQHSAAQGSQTLSQRSFEDSGQKRSKREPQEPGK